MKMTLPFTPLLSASAGVELRESPPRRYAADAEIRRLRRLMPLI